jgi:hypothetical protein
VDERSIEYGDVREQDHPHCCMDGYVYLGYTALDEETGEEVERVEALPCRRCASEAGEISPTPASLAYRGGAMQNFAITQL